MTEHPDTRGRAPAAPNGSTPAEPENLAEAIRKISAAVSRLARSGLNKKAIIVLVSDSSGIGKRTVEQVINSLDDLARMYTTRGAGK